MITPVVENSTWLERLSDLPPWQAPALPVLVVAPHPDDETLGCGALIATLRAGGIPVSVIAATDGENCYDTPADEREAMRYIREGEQQEALGVLGVSPQNIHRLRLRDSGLHLLESELTAGIRHHAQQGMHLLAPWIGDFHPDHEACARAALAVAKELDLTLTWYFFWTWHRGTPSLLDGLRPQRFVPDATALRKKVDALQCHRSQLVRPGGDPILPDYLLGPAYWPFEVFLSS